LIIMQVEEYLKEQRKTRRALLFVLIDSEISDIEKSTLLATQVEKAGASAILVGGSSATDQIEMSAIVGKLKDAVKIPIILFPGNTTGVVPGADAILFSSLMNSENPYFITQAQALAAPTVLRFELEPLPTAYLIVGDGTSAWFVGGARAIPFNKHKIAAAFALAARFLGMRFVYLEAGSGAASSVRPEMVAAVRKVFDGLLIVGGGIRDAKSARRLMDAGADILVVGTLAEDGKIDELRKIIAATQES